MSERLLGSDGIDVGHRQSLTLLIPEPTRGKSMQVRMWLDSGENSLAHTEKSKDSGQVRRELRVSPNVAWASYRK